MYRSNCRPGAKGRCFFRDFSILSRPDIFLLPIWLYVRIMDLLHKQLRFDKREKKRKKERERKRVRKREEIRRERA